MNAEDKGLVLGATKHLTTLTTAAMAFVVTMLFTYFKDTPYILSAEVSLGFLLLSVLFGALTQLMIVTETLGDRVMFRWINLKTLLFLAWVFLVAGISSLVVSLWANLHLKHARERVRNEPDSVVSFSILGVCVRNLDTVRCALRRTAS